MEVREQGLEGECVGVVGGVPMLPTDFHPTSASGWGRLNWVMNQNIKTACEPPPVSCQRVIFICVCLLLCVKETEHFRNP